MLQFTHLLLEAKSKYSTNIRPYVKTHDILESVDGFSQISFNYNTFPPVKIKTKPMIFILRRKDGVKVPKIPPRKIVKPVPEPETVAEPEPQPEEPEPELEESEEIVEKPDFEPELPEPEPKSEEEELTQDEPEVPEEKPEISDIDAEIEDLGKDILDEEILNEINELNEMETNDLGESLKIKEAIKKILQDYKEQLSGKGNILNVKMIKNRTEGKKSRKIKPTPTNLNANESKMEQDKDLEDALSLKEGSIITDEGELKPELGGEKKRKKKKKNKKETETVKEEKPTEEENVEGSWLNFF